MKNKMKKTKLLYIAYFYPPVESGGLPAALRTIKFLKYVIADAYVLTKKINKKYQVNEKTNLTDTNKIYRAGTIDIFGTILGFRKKLKTILKKEKENPTSSTKKVSVFSSGEDKNKKSNLQNLKDFIYNLNYFPDQASVWVLKAFIMGRNIIKEKDIDIIFATGSPWSSLILGYLLSKTTGKALIADFRDPWIGNPFHHSKGKLLDKWAEKLEDKVVRQAKWVTLNTAQLQQEFIHRYPGIPTDKFVVLPNGFDLSDFADISQQHSPNHENLIIRHAGFLYGPRDPSLLLDAIQLANAKATEIGITNRCIFEQIGNIGLEFDISDKYQSMIKNGDFIITPQLPYEECLAKLSDADLLVNIQPGTKTQVPSKIYDYLAIGRPILNITPVDGALGKMVSEYGFGEIIDFNELDKLTQLLLKHLQALPERPTADYQNKQFFAIEAIAKKLDSLIDATN